MKKVLAALVLFLGLVFSANAADELVLGRDYRVIKANLNVPQKSIIEVFNIGCVHCANINSILPQLFDVIDKDVVFLPYHVATSAQFSKESSNLVALALQTDKERGQNPRDLNSNYKKVVTVLFDAVFTQRKRFANANEFIALGLEAMKQQRAVYDQFVKSNELKNTLGIWQGILPAAQIRGIPSFIINGKYVLILDNIKSAEDLIFKISLLLDK